MFVKAAAGSDTEATDEREEAHDGPPQMGSVAQAPLVVVNRGVTAEDKSRDLPREI